MAFYSHSWTGIFHLLHYTIISSAIFFDCGLSLYLKLCTSWRKRIIFNQNFFGFRPSGQPCVETKEFDLVRNMLIAAVEERYRDAGIEFLHFGTYMVFNNIWIS